MGKVWCVWQGLRVVVFIALFSIFSCGACRAAEEGEFPKIGFVKNDDADVRAGDNVNFETLCKLKKGGPVKITDKRYSWFKIVLPKTACLYIKNDYVDVSDERGMGIVNAKSVNLRAGPDTKYSILGQVSMPDKITVLAEGGGWYKIEPPAGITGWIHSDQITFEMETGEDGEVKKTQPAMQKKESKNITLKLSAPEPKGNLVFSTQNN